MGKKLTPEQEEQAQKRREKFRALVGEVAAMTDEQRATLASRMPVVSVEGHVYSVHNQALLALQVESATICGGFRQWQRNGRKVRKGEGGLMIWVAAHKGKEGEGEVQDVEDVRFFMGYVWDVSQTEPMDGKDDGEHPSIVRKEFVPKQTVADKVSTILGGVDGQASTV